MKREATIKLQRDFFWNRAVEFEQLYDNTGNDAYLSSAEAFAVMVGALDWVLLDDFAEAKLTPEGLVDGETV